MCTKRQDIEHHSWGARRRFPIRLFDSAAQLIHLQHTKAISSAILNSDLNLTPQVDSQNTLQLNIQLPTPTAESRQATVKTAIDLAAKANDGIRNARGAQQKKLRSFSLGRAARPDDLKKAGDRMEKVVTDGGVEVKRILDGVKKVLESG